MSTHWYKLLDYLFGPWLASKADKLITALTDKMPEITTLAIILCAFAMMIPMLDTGKWFARAVSAMFIGVVWMVAV